MLRGEGQRGCGRRGGVLWEQDDRRWAVRTPMSRHGGSIRGGAGDAGAVLAAGLEAHRAGRFEQALALYDRVLAADKRHAGAMHLKGVALLQCSNLAEAEQWLRRSVKIRPGHAPAHSDLGLCLMRLGRAQEAVATFSTAVKLQPEAVEVHVNRGLALAMLGRHAEALGAFERGLARRPGDVEISLHQASALLALGRHEDAKSGVDRVLARVPAHPLALKVRGDIAGASGSSDEAETWYGKAIASAPDHPTAILARAGLRLSMGRAAEAVSDFDRVLQLMPGLPEALAGRGAALLLADQPRLALESLEAAVGSGMADAETLANLSVALLINGRGGDALSAAEGAVKAAPDLASGWLARGNALGVAGRFAEALDSYDAALRLRPGYIDALYEKAATLRRLDRQQDAAAACADLLSVDPDNFEARWLAAFGLLPAVPMTQQEADAARDRLASDLTALEAQADRDGNAWRAVGRIKPFYLTYQERDNRALIERYGKLSHRLMEAWRIGRGLTVELSRAPIDGRKIRVGFITSDFNHHSIWTAITKGWVRGLDAGRFEVCLFHTGDRIDAQTQIAREHAASFTDGRRSLADWVRAIAEARLDCAVYPEIGVDPIALRLACLRLAPLQATTWGHPDTSGLPTIDLFLSGEAFEPAGAQSHYSERLVRLPGTGVNYTSLGVTPSLFQPAAHGLPEGRPLLVSPGTPFKYAPQHDRVLVEIARRAPQAIIVMFEPQIEHRAMFERLLARLRGAFGEASLVLDDHVRVLGWLKPGDFFGLMTRADAFLDTIGFSGFNTAMQAVECGLPIVTREGRFLRGRLASALYREMGLSELIAADEAAYVDMAVRLATDRAWRDEIGARLAEARAALLDDERAIRALEGLIEVECRTALQAREAGLA